MSYPHAGDPVLRVNGLRKAFGATLALADAALEVRAGEIHALLGGNGSGKSTAIKIMAGVIAADEGTIEVGGVQHAAASFGARQAREAGLRFVHQQQSTLPALTVAENLAIGHGFECGRLGRIRWGAQRRRAAGILERFAIDVDPDAALERLTPATQAKIAIARALQDGERPRGVLFLDEPTSALPREEVEELLSALQRYAAAGQAIVYVTHRLSEVVRIADTATVLRDGRVAATVACRAATEAQLAETIMGRTVAQLRTGPARAPATGERLRVEGLAGGPLRDVSLTVRPGEIVGVAGLLGSGRSTLLRLLFGAIAREGGSVTLDGDEVRWRAPRDAVAAGVAFVPEDRPRDAALLDLDVLANIGLTTTRSFFRRGLLRTRAECREAERLMERFHVKAASPRAPLSTLSGGNQQKVILARWLRREPRLLLLDEPSQGVDVGARLEIWQMTRAAVAAGAAALVVSSDLDELPSVCDRVLVLGHGQVVAELGEDELAGGALDQAVLTSEVTHVGA